MGTLDSDVQGALKHVPFKVHQILKKVTRRSSQYSISIQCFIALSAHFKCIRTNSENMGEVYKLYISDP